MAHGRRMSDKLHKIAIDFCVIRDGKKCAHCGWTYGDRLTRFQRRHPVNKEQRLELNHIDGNPGKNQPSNWNLLCTSCNLWWSPMNCGTLMTGEAGEIEKGQVENETRPGVIHNPERKATDSVDNSGGGGGEIESIELMERNSATSRVRNEVAFKEGETTLQANARFEPPFRLYCLTKVRNLGKVLMDDLEAGGAEKVGCSLKTAEKYLKKLTGPEGALRKVIEDGNTWVVMKAGSLPVKVHKKEEGLK
jgi:hypothetical protein